MVCQNGSDVLGNTAAIDMSVAGASVSDGAGVEHPARTVTPAVASIASAAARLLR
jgi:hypothetical protein